MKRYLMQQPDLLLQSLLADVTLHQLRVGRPPANGHYRNRLPQPLHSLQQQKQILPFLDTTNIQYIGIRQLIGGTYSRHLRWCHRLAKDRITPLIEYLNLRFRNLEKRDQISSGLFTDRNDQIGHLTGFAKFIAVDQPVNRGIELWKTKKDQVMERHHRCHGGSVDTDR